MKKVWAVRNSEDGVSPVVATILLVAITVVLAAILYVMVSGIGNLGSISPPVISTSKGNNLHNYTWTITAIGGGRLVLKDEVFVQLKNETEFVITTVMLENASGTHGFKYTPGSTGDYISTGDVFSLDKAYNLGTTITLVNTGATGQYTILYI